jgi:hypothetical protein
LDAGQPIQIKRCIRSIDVRIEPSTNYKHSKLLDGFEELKKSGFTFTSYEEKLDSCSDRV